MGRYLFTLAAAVSFIICMLCPELSFRAQLRQTSAVEDFASQSQALSRGIEGQSKQLTEYLHDHPLPSSAETAEENRRLQEMNRLLADEGRLAVAQRAVLKSKPFPYGDLTLPAAVLPLLWVAYASWLWERTKTRIRKNQCIACGYDLRATPDRCPECGRENTKLTFARRFLGNLRLEM